MGRRHSCRSKVGKNRPELPVCLRGLLNQILSSEITSLDQINHWHRGGRQWGLGPNVPILVLSFEHFQMACLIGIFNYFLTQSDNCRYTVFYFDEGCLRDTVHLLYMPPY